MDIEVIQEHEYIDNMPENLEDSERHENVETAVDNLGCAYDSLQECIDYLQDVVDN